jgi:glucuronoarabinoxylan endo-1,4-beta-xylanase
MWYFEAMVNTHAFASPSLWIAAIVGACSTSNPASAPADATSADSSAQDSPDFDATTACANAVTIDATTKLQTIDGFGAADLWLPPMTDAQADMFFDPQKGIGLSLLRVGIDENGAIDQDGADAPPYSDATKAAARGALIWASTYTPPAADKSNGDLDDGGTLLAADYDAWATTLAGFAGTLYAQSGVHLYGLSLQNEPDYATSYPSCVFSPSEVVAFANVLGPKLHALNPPVKLLAPETFAWPDLWTTGGAYGLAILNDPAASTNVDILATHQYDNGVVTPIPTGMTFSQRLWMTEASGTVGSIEAGPSSDIANGIAVANWIHNALVVGGANAWSYWWLQPNPNAANDNEGLLLQDGTITKRLWTMGNFSKFIRPGATRIGVSAAPSGASISAYQNTDSSIVVVAINANATPVSVCIVLAGASGSTATPWETSASQDLQQLPSIAIVDQGFVAALDPQSVTTFVVR